MLLRPMRRLPVCACGEERQVQGTAEAGRRSSEWRWNGSL